MYSWPLPIPFRRVYLLKVVYRVTDAFNLATSVGGEDRLRELLRRFYDLVFDDVRHGLVVGLQERKIAASPTGEPGEPAGPRSNSSQP